MQKTHLIIPIKIEKIPKIQTTKINHKMRVAGMVVATMMADNNTKVVVAGAVAMEADNKMDNNGIEIVTTLPVSNPA